MGSFLAMIRRRFRAKKKGAGACGRPWRKGPPANCSNYIHCRPPASNPIPPSSCGPAVPGVPPIPRRGQRYPSNQSCSPIDFISCFFFSPPPHLVFSPFFLFLPSSRLPTLPLPQLVGEFTRELSWPSRLFRSSQATTRQRSRLGSQAGQMLSSPSPTIRPTLSLVPSSVILLLPTH